MAVGGTVLASVPVNSEAGSYLTFAFPVILFCVIGAILYVLLFGRPHARVPARRITAPAHAGPPSPEPGGAVSAATTTTGSVSGEPAGAGDSEHATTQGPAATEGAASTESTEASE